jgi:pimeloyl-ACP methyl ester carboxylesterase
MQTARSADGTTIAFDRSGQGPALILVAAASATRMAQAGLAAALAPDFTVFAYDRRGRGDSGDTLPYAVEREVEDLDALIDEAGGSAFVFGHSSGAVLALEAARLRPGKISKLAVYEAPFIIDDSRPPTPPDFLSRLNGLLAAGDREGAVVLWNRNIGLPDEMIAGMRGSPWWPGLLAVAHTLPYDMTIMGDTQSGSSFPLGKWANVSAPTLVMDGTLFLGRENGHGWMRHGADELTRILPNGQRRTLEGQDHGPADDVLAPALKEFFLGHVHDFVASPSVVVDAPGAKGRSAS